MKAQHQLRPIGAALCLLFTACSSDHSKAGGEQSTPALSDTLAVEASPPALPPFRIQTFQNKDQSWGYDLYLGERRYIHQPHLPALGGNLGFASEAQALRVAALVTEKIRRGILPPSVTSAEVDSLLRLE